MPARDDVTVNIIAETRQAVAGVKAFATAVAAAMGAVKTLENAVENAKLAQEFQNVSRAFNRMAADAGRDGATVVRAIKDAAGGAISSLDATRAASRAALMGLPIDRLEQMMQIASSSATATGESVSFMFESITTAISRQSPLLLDNLGIVMDVGDANAQYAASLGKTVQELSAAEKQTAFLNAAMEAGQELVERTGPAQVDHFEAMRAAIDDLKVAMGEGLLPVFSRLAEFVTTLIDRFLELRRQHGAMQAAFVHDVPTTVEGIRGQRRHLLAASISDQTALNNFERSFFHAEILRALNNRRLFGDARQEALDDSAFMATLMDEIRAEDPDKVGRFEGISSVQRFRERLATVDAQLERLKEAEALLASLTDIPAPDLANSAGGAVGAAAGNRFLLGSVPQGLTMDAMLAHAVANQFSGLQGVSLGLGIGSLPGGLPSAGGPGMFPVSSAGLMGSFEDRVSRSIFAQTPQAPTDIDRLEQALADLALPEKLLNGVGTLAASLGQAAGAGEDLHDVLARQVASITREIGMLLVGAGAREILEGNKLGWGLVAFGAVLAFGGGAMLGSMARKEAEGRAAASGGAGSGGSSAPSTRNLVPGVDNAPPERVRVVNIHVEGSVWSRDELEDQILEPLSGPNSGGFGFG